MKKGFFVLVLCMSFFSYAQENDTNEGDWFAVEAMPQDGTLCMDPELIEFAEQALVEQENFASGIQPTADGELFPCLPPEEF